MLMCIPKFSIRGRAEVTRPQGCGWADLGGEVTWLFTV